MRIGRARRGRSATARASPAWAWAVWTRAVWIAAVGTSAAGVGALWTSAAAAQPILVGGAVLPGEGDPIEDATVVLDGERIVSVTAGGPVPAGATRVDCDGAILTPGFVGTASPLGLVEIGLEPSTDDQAPEGDDADPVRASFQAADGYNPRSTLIPVARRWGVTSVVSTPSGGLVSGTSAWVDLRGATLDDVLVEPLAALHVNLGDAGVAASGGSRATAFGRLREVFDDAQLYRRRRPSFDRRGLRELSVSRLDLERLAGALAGDFPVVVHVSRASDILRALALGQRYGLRIALEGAEEAWMVAPQIAAADVPVIVQPLTNLPEQFSRLHSRYDNAARLEAAGVEVIVSAGADAHGQRNLRQEAGNAIATGLSREAALAAVTVRPARLFGVDDRYGTIAPGKVANLVVWTGDPFELTTWARHVFIRGEDVPLATRQTLLFERYRDLDRVPRGQRSLPRPQD